MIQIRLIYCLFCIEFDYDCSDDPIRRTLLFIFLFSLQFFMKGTQLTQLCEDYEIIRESIETTRVIVTRKKSVSSNLHTTMQ